jgi:glycosyltransferase involved in cell wall biosynthesis
MSERQPNLELRSQSETEVVIVHNHPVHYKDLLFTELKHRGLRFHVIFVGRNRGHALAPIKALSHDYEYSFSSMALFERRHVIPTVTGCLRVLNRIDPRIVIIGGYSYSAAWASWAWARLRRRPVIFWGESNECDFPRVWWKEAVKGYFLRSCARAHVYGTTNKEYLVKLGMRAADIVIKRAVLDVDAFVPWGAKSFAFEKKNVFLYVGRFAPEKNIPAVLRAIKEVSRRRRDTQPLLVLVGGGPLEPELRRMVRDLEMDPQVMFAGVHAQAELPGIYRAADFFVLPSTCEPWGLVANEALACGVPVIVSDRCGCARDLVTPSTGWLFSPSDEGSLVQAMERALTTPPERLASMKREARQLGCQYSTTLCAEAVLESIASVAGGEQRAGGPPG